MDQIVECFPNTLLKLLPDMISKTKWNKKAKEVETWEHWWEMHAKVGAGQTINVTYNVSLNMSPPHIASVYYYGAVEESNFTFKAAPPR